MHQEIKKITDQPAKNVVLENGQGHAALGTSYWQEQGATIIAHQDAAHETGADAFQRVDRMQTRNREKAMGTKVPLPDETFIEMGSERIELLNLDPSHSPGDIIVWLPQHILVIADDMTFLQRMLPVFEHTDTAAWIDTWTNSPRCAQKRRPDAAEQPSPPPSEAQKSAGLRTAKPGVLSTWV